MKRKFKSLLYACSAAALLSAGQAGAAVLLSDNFDAEAQGLNYTGFANWNVTAGSVDVIGTGFFDLYPGHGNYVDLAGSTGTGGTLTSKQSYSIAPGQSLGLTFDLGGSARGTNDVVTVSLAGTTLATLNMLSSDPLTQHSLSLTNNTGSLLSGFLSFRNLTGGTQGAILDNVILSSSGGQIPEPASAALLALGLGILVLKRPRRGRWY